MEEFKTQYGIKVRNIIEILEKDKIKISLHNIQQKYLEIYKEKKSLMTFSRIMKYHLNKHFIKTTVKNPKLNKNLYKFLSHFFIKGIVRSLKLGLKLIFIDETGFQLENNNYYCWRCYKEEIQGGATIKLKDRINLISAVDDKEIIHFKIINKTVKHNDFIDFMEEMKDKIGENEIKKYVLIMDNAKYHLHKQVKKFVLNHKLKILTNCPYLSKFNGIEYVFRTIKTQIYKKLINNKKELKKNIIGIINDIKTAKIIEKIYLKELREYSDFIKKNENTDLNELFIKRNL